MQYKILIVEDETDINGLLVKLLSGADYQTTQAFSGTEAKLLLEREIPDLILLDLMLPGIPGEKLLREIRYNKQCNVPVLVISAKNSLDDKVSLLKNGADDYITKPFVPEEVLARVQAAIRRSGKKNGTAQTFTHKNLRLYPDSRTVMLYGKELLLTAHEFDILSLLMKNPERVYSRESIYEQIWNGGYYGENNTVNVHVSNLRKKLKEADPKEEYIQTVYGIGFKLL